MGEFITPTGLDLTVYGQAQVSYTVGGEADRSWTDAVLKSAYRRAVSMEAEASAVGEATRYRTRKLDELGTVLAAVAEAVAKLSEEKWDSGKTVGGLKAARAVLEKYGIDGYTEISVAGEVNKQQGAILQSKVKLAIDIENNALQQDSSSLQSLVTKRDSSYSQLGKLMNKFLRSRKSIISNIRG